MYTAQINFKINPNTDGEELLGLVNSLLGSWRMNGQVLGREFPISQSNGAFSVFVQTPENDSLASEYGNKYTSRDLQNIEGKYTTPEVLNVGIDPEGAKTCRCRNPGYYILFTTYISIESPLRCGACFGCVPLYKIQKTYDDEYYNIITWASDYQSCDSLQMNCKVGEYFSMDQMSGLNSELTKQGLEVCASISDVTRKKVFYYLYKGTGDSYAAEEDRKCPGCSSAWLREKPLHNKFNFKCNRCSLLSNIAWDCQ